MKKSLRNLMVMLIVLMGFHQTNGQNSVITVPPLSGGNSQSGITFNLETTIPIQLTDIQAALLTSTQDVSIWYNTTPINGAPTITTANGWTLIQTTTETGLSANTSSPVLTTIPLATPLVLQPGNYGFFVESTANMPYSNWSTGAQSAFTDGTITIETGSNVGYGGGAPNPTFTVRQFNGGVNYTIVALTPDNAALTSIDSPDIFCSGDSTDIIVTVGNYGTNQIDSLQVTWSIDGIIQGSMWYNSTLDTINGNGTYSAQVNLGSYAFANAFSDLAVWTSNPNNNVDSDSSNDSLQVTVHPSLSGTYTIGASMSADFADFTSAVSTLEQFGVCGPVLFNVEAGTYTEQIVINAITGVDSTNDVTFTSANGDNTSVILDYNNNTSSDNYTVYLDGADHFNFQNITISNSSTGSYSRVVYFENGADSNTISNCILEGPVATSTSTNYAVLYNASSSENDDYNTISGNEFRNGSYGAYWYGDGSSALEEGNVFENNTVKNSYYSGLYLYYQNAPVVKGNKVSSNSSYTSGYGISLGYSDNHIVVADNHIFPDSATTNWPYYGLRIYYCDAQLTSSSEVYNNRVVMGGTSTSTRYALYFYNSTFQTYANNTGIVAAGSSSSRALYEYSGDFSSYYNNAFINLAGGYSAYYSSQALWASDNNAWYSTDMSNLGYVNGTVTDLAGFQSGLGTDANSIVADPIVSDTANALFCADSLNNAGQPVSFVVNDYEGEMRSSTTPDIGANEYQSVVDFNVFDDFVICDNSDSTFTLAYNYDYVVWGTALDTATSYTVSQAGQYYVQAASACGTFFDTAQAYAQETPTLPFNMNICTDEVAQISSGITNPAMVSWSTGATTDSIDISVAGVYTVEVIDTVGCYSIDSVNVTQSPAVDLPDSLNICENNTEFLDAQIQGSYAWSTGSTNQTILVNSTGIYSVVVTDQYGCVSTDTTNAIVIELPDTTYTTNTSYLTVEFFSTNQAGVNYVWDFGDGNSATGPNAYHVYDWKGEFIATLTAYNDCDTITTEFYVFPDIVSSVEDQATVLSKVSVYPNPSNGIFNLGFELTESHSVSYEIIDAQGQLIMNKNMGVVSGNIQEEINLNEASSGIYFIKIKTGSSVEVYRLSKF